MPPIKLSWSTRILCGLAFIVLAAGIVVPVFMSEREPDRYHAGCRGNLRQIGLGVLQYVQDYDERLPPVRCQGNAYGWADSLLPYVKHAQVYQCRPQGERGQSDPRKSGYTDYVFNARFEKLGMEAISHPAQKVLVLDGNRKGDVTDARYAFSQIPGAWFTDKTSPLYRHLETANYLFADGHVKGYKPSDICGANQPLF